MAYGHKTEHRPPVFTPLQVAEVKALACRLPAARVPLARWSCPELAREAVPRDIAGFVSASTVRRWLTEGAIKPGSSLGICASHGPAPPPDQ
ncbi:helix-turn-helix domain-containing protein [Streptomyces sp. NPDC014724]|uniref:helix-turn-helix domain-containing protein n=1 Tax=unclassified Streptomyces TaxID=2593676 RepID=UPI0036F6C874